jgi:hypothetical protein
MRTPVAIPRPAALLTVIVYVAVAPVGVCATDGVLVTFATVSCGLHSAPKPLPGTEPDDALVLLEPDVAAVVP